MPFNVQRQIDVYHLEPNTTYCFRVWATNQLGRGEIVEIEGHTHHSVEELGTYSGMIFLTIIFIIAL